MSDRLLIGSLVAALVKDADRAAMEGVLKAMQERYDRENQPMVTMCGCEDWLTCEHPWPMIFHPVSFTSIYGNCLARLSPEA